MHSTKKSSKQLQNEDLQVTKPCAANSQRNLAVESPALKQYGGGAAITNNSNNQGSIGTTSGSSNQPLPPTTTGPAAPKLPQKKAQIRAGDWICQRCNNHNFSFRTNCNMCHLSHDLSEMMLSIYRSQRMKTYSQPCIQVMNNPVNTNM